MPPLAPAASKFLMNIHGCQLCKVTFTLDLLPVQTSTFLRSVSSWLFLLRVAVTSDPMLTFAKAAETLMGRSSCSSGLAPHERTGGSIVL